LSSTNQPNTKLRRNAILSLVALAVAGSSIFAKPANAAPPCPPDICNFSAANNCPCPLTYNQEATGHTSESAPEPADERVSNKGCLDCDGNCITEVEITVITHFYSCTIRDQNGVAVDQGRLQCDVDTVNANPIPCLPPPPDEDPPGGGGIPV
jgi:hypothetical protein